jgi:hypothetical protein
VMEKLGPESASKIDWTGPRLLCIAGDFTKYDEYAVMQIPRSGATGATEPTCCCWNW